MARALPRTGFNSSRLIRFLADLGSADGTEAKQSFAERLGLWLDVTDAIALFSALNGSAAEAGAASPSAAADAVQERFERVRSALAAAITAEGMRQEGRARTRSPAPGGAAESAADFSPYRRCYLAHQRDMEASIAPLRAQARAALASRSPRLGRLAAVDAVLEQALSGRERSLLASLPAWLEKRFEHLRQAHQEAVAGSGAPDDPELWLQPGGWLAAFGKDMQGLLLAELDLRLQPVAGLIEALGNEVTKNQ